MKSMGWTTKDTLRSMTRDINDRAFGPEYSPPKYNSKVSKKPMNCCDRCSCECIKKIETTILRDESPPKVKENYQQNNGIDFMFQQQQNNTPKRMPHYALPRNEQCNRQQQLEPLQPTQLSSISKPKPKFSPKLSRTSLLSGGVELVPLFVSL
jgi:hypothetical protein